MAEEIKRPLKVFLCHASGDKLAVRELYKRLVAEGVDAWLDQEKLLPGQDWGVEIPRAVREADVVVVCLSNRSITKEGYIQKEIKFALDNADEKPEGSIFLIPARLEECAVPERLSRWQWVDLFEEHGFDRLLRSLKLRANRVGATVEPADYESEDQEIEHRLDQLYTEGLAAFYTEDWDRAYQRFQTILRERPSHKNAAEKLVQAERQRNLVKLYVQGTEAYKSENWLDAIKALEELLEKSGDYKDAVQLLKDAKKQKQLKELYVEAKRLHAAQKWQAVIRVFDQIALIDSAYPDPEGLLPSAQKEAAELKRLADLNDLYRQGVHKMDAGEWYEARSLLEQVHKAQTGFLDTERLLRKVEDEIVKIEERNKRNNQINILYEQAHGLIRSKSWRMVLDKMEEIQKLDHQFVDQDGIFEKAKTELEHEEEAVQRQNELAAMYTEAVRLLKEGKYQEALDKWQEVKSINPKYPDRQRVQTIARRKLTELGKSPPTKTHLAITKPILIGVIGLVAIVALFLFAKDSTSSHPFLNPMVEGYRLDWCLSLGENCGEGAAAEWCKSKGYVGVVSFGPDFSGMDTKVISSGELCYSACGSFSFISCQQAQNRLSSLATSFAPRPVTSHFWSFDNNTQGWNGFHHVSTPKVSNGFMTFKSTGIDPLLHSPESLEISASVISIITIRMRVIQEQSSEGQIYFVTDRDNNWNEAKRVSFFVGKDDGMFKTYDIPMSTNPYWKDVITQFRLDPISDLVDAQITIDFISVHAP